MHPDELNKPLGVDADTAALPRREIPWAGIAFGGLLFLGGGIFAFARLTDSAGVDPALALAALSSSQRPVAARQDARPEASGDDVTSSIAAAPPRASADQVEEASGVRVIRQGGGGAPGALIISVPQQVVVGLSPAPDRRLVEEGRFGPLPKIGADGSKPMDVYGRPLVTSAKLRSGAPKIGILIGGMGLNARATAAAIETLPTDVTLGFAPYGAISSSFRRRRAKRGTKRFCRPPCKASAARPRSPARTCCAWKGRPAKSSRGCTGT